MKHNEQTVSLDQMAEQFRREIFAYIQTKVGDRAAAEDLTQETFLKVQNSLSKESWTGDRSIVARKNETSQD